MVAKESKEMAEAADKLLQISEDERAQAYALSYENAVFARQLYEQDKWEEAEEKGHRVGWLKGQEEGRLKGKAEGRIEGQLKGQHERSIEIARNLILMGLSNEEISNATGLSISEIEKISKK